MHPDQLDYNTLEFHTFIVYWSRNCVQSKCFPLAVEVHKLTGLPIKAGDDDAYKCVYRVR